MTTNNEKRDALQRAMNLLAAAGNPADSAIVAEVCNEIKPDITKKAMSTLEFTNFVVQLLDFTDQDAGGTMSAADFLQEILDVIDIQGVNIPWEPAIHSTKVDLDLNDPAWDEDDGKGEPDGSEGYEPPDKTGVSPADFLGIYKRVETDIIPPHNIPKWDTEAPF